MLATEIRADQLLPWQAQAMAVPEQLDLALTGGRGGGKTHLLCALFLRHAEQHGEQARCLVVRKSFPGLMDLEAELRSYLSGIYGSALRYDGQRHRFALPNGATIQLDQLESEVDFQKYQGKSYSMIAVDEAGQWASPALVDRLRSSLRAPESVPIRFILLANPGGAGHHWIARRHALRQPWMPYVCGATGADFVTIPSTYAMNSFIDRDRYAKNLMAACATDPELAKAWLNGDWSIARGAYFATVIDEHRNMTEAWSSLPGADLAPIGTKGYRFVVTAADRWKFYVSHDFGVSAPSVTYLCALSPGDTGPCGTWFPRGSLVLFDEVALVHPDDPNKGLGLTVPDQAALIVDRCKQWGMRAEGAADDAIFNKTGSQSGTIADEFRKAGVTFWKAKKGSRIGGWQMMARLLADAGKPDVPGMYVSRRCSYWWETVPSLPRDPRRPEDVDSSAADHAADACRYACTREQPILVTGIRSAM